MNEQPLYITTTLPYVNAKPHVGHALELVQADVLARTARLVGRRVFFNTGADEHGQKIWEKAQSEGQDTQAYVDHYAQQLAGLKPALGLSNDVFIRTTSPAHEQAAQELWRRCQAKGDIEKRQYRGLYCVSCEMFLQDKDQNEAGRCHLHPDQEPTELEEENYFFCLSNYQDRLVDYLSKPGVIVPEHRRQEALRFVQEGLEDFSISRQRDRMAWGVSVPDDGTQVMYVWFDALTNYISTLGWPEEGGDYQKFWVEGERVQMAGKDQVRFQSIMWQAMLMSADLPTTEQVFYHGFITSAGKKMSKSIGNVIDPMDLVAHYGTDAVRYYLLRHIHPTDDSDLTLAKFHESYTAHLVNGLGNLVSRVLNMAEKYGVQISEAEQKPLMTEQSEFPENLLTTFFEYEFLDGMDQIWTHIAELDKSIDTEKPFIVAKTDEAEAGRLVRAYCLDLITIWSGLRPVMPETAEKLRQALLALKKPDQPLFPRMDSFVDEN